ncbi:MAG: bifunctional folylpolyglutamate synthase/dihydrofolate synthase [Planctomycetes bacterium]|nr:bifunctional folylpolyglutamate synthase/dihydrofolate synthase [Planctomycetota bacterium]
MSEPIRTRRELDELLRGSTNYENMPEFHAGRVRTDLRRMLVYVERLAHPERASPVAHVTGTKGKGSTAALAARLLQALGAPVGLHTSPHLERLEERVAVDFEPIGEEDLLAAASEVVAARAAGPDPGFPTFFEFITLVAFLHFRRRAAACAVHEVGMGGALDATNVVQPEATAITNVTLEHAAVLGGTVEAIAAEKAGIIKPGVPVVTGVRPGDSAWEPIAAAAAHAGAPLLRLGQDLRVLRVRRCAGGGLEAHVRTARADYPGLRLGLCGVHQADNLALAIGLVEILAERLGCDFAAPTARAALAGFALPGRLEKAGSEPIVLIDGAHTPESLRLAVEETRLAFAAARTVVLFAMAGDKDLAAAACILARAGQVVTTAYASPRAADPGRLEQLIRSSGGSAQAVADPGEALERALHLAGRDGLVLVVGSMYLAGCVRAGLRARLEPAGGGRRSN